MGDSIVELHEAELQDLPLGLKFEPLRRLEKRARRFQGHSGNGNSHIPPPPEDEIMDALAEEYGHRAQYRLNFVFLGSFLLFLGVYFSLLYSQLANSQAYKMNIATQNILPSTFNSSGVQVFGQFSDVTYWLANSIVADIWREPECGNGPCDAPLEIPGGIFRNHGCAADCGDVQDVVVHVTLLGETARSFREEAPWQLQMCWFARYGTNPSNANIRDPKNCTSGKHSKPQLVLDDLVKFDVNYFLDQGHLVDWAFYVPESGGNFILNLTISERIVRQFGSISGSFYTTNSFDAWWISNSGNHSLAINSGVSLAPQNPNPESIASSVTGKNCPVGSTPAPSNCSWPYKLGDQPLPSMPCCQGNLGNSLILPTVNPTRIYGNLVKSTPRTLGGSTKQSNRVLMGILLHLTRRPYSHKQCGNFTHTYNQSTDTSSHSYPERFGKLSPWCPHEQLLPTSPFGEDPYFSNKSSLFRNESWQEYYPASKTLEGRPYAFFDTTRSFHSIDANKDAFFVLLDIDLNATQVTNWIRFLEDGGFLDMNAHVLVIRVLVYNGIYKLFSEFKMELLMDDSGSISYQYRIDAFSVFEDNAVIVLFSLFLVGLVVLLLWEVISMVEAARNGWGKLLSCLHRHILEIVTNGLFVVSVFLWRFIHQQIKTFNPDPRYDVYKNLLASHIPMLELNPPPAGGGPSQAEEMHRQFRKFEDLIQHKKFYVFISSVNTVLVLWRALQMSHFHPRLGILTRTLVNIVPDIMAYFFVWAVITFGYAVMGMITFGDQLTEFNSFSQAFNSMLALYLGTIDVNLELMSISTTIWDQIPSRIFFWSYMIVANLVLLNFLIAIVIDMFSDVKSKNGLRERLVNRMSSEAAFTLGSWKYTKAAYHFRLLISDYEERTKKFYLGRFKRFLASPTYLLGQFMNRIIYFFRTRRTGRRGKDGDHGSDEEAEDVQLAQADGNGSQGEDLCSGELLERERAMAAGSRGPPRPFRGPTEHTRKFRRYKFKALIVDGVEVQNSYLASIFAARLQKVTGKPQDIDGVRWLVSYVLACYGGESKSQKGFYEEHDVPHSEKLGVLAQDLKSEISEAIREETEDMASMLSTLQANIKNNMATLQEQLDIIAEDVCMGSMIQSFGDASHSAGEPQLTRAGEAHLTRSQSAVDAPTAAAHSSLPVAYPPQGGGQGPLRLAEQPRVMTFSQPVDLRAAALQAARRDRLQRLGARRDLMAQVPHSGPQQAAPATVPPRVHSALPPGFSAQPMSGPADDLLSGRDSQHGRT